MWLMSRWGTFQALGRIKKSTEQYILAYTTKMSCFIDPVLSLIAEKVPHLDGKEDTE